MFIVGVDLGEHVDEPMTVSAMLKETRTVVSDDIFKELCMLDIVMTKLELSGTRHNEVLYGVALEAVRDRSLSNEQKVESIRSVVQQLKALIK